jgi:hypothetical protein
VLECSFWVAGARSGMDARRRCGAFLRREVASRSRRATSARCSSGEPSNERASSNRAREILSVCVGRLASFSIEVETDGDLRAAIAEARLQYEKSGTQWPAHAEIEIDDAEIFGVDEIDPTTGAITSSRDFESISASVGQPIDLEN